MPKLAETRKAWVPALVGLLMTLQDVDIEGIIAEQGDSMSALITIAAMLVAAYMTPNDPPKAK